MMISGVLAGLVPLLPVLAFDYPTSLYLSVATALIVLFLLGYVKGKLLNTNPFRGGIKILIVGGLATILGLVVGLIFEL